jgi:hypothetical protein
VFLYGVDVASVKVGANRIFSPPPLSAYSDMFSKPAKVERMHLFLGEPSISGDQGTHNTQEKSPTRIAILQASCDSHTGDATIY